ncbi:hypothetical protein MGSAQ_002762 [marine sediment metagenome]|uniref:Uncharacterized protein n=1 Tax=marine sediment metagenome TaxID=412755 RepID=A0A1B6NS33_9ZZZZ
MHIGLHSKSPTDLAKLSYNNSLKNQQLAIASSFQFISNACNSKI